MFGNLGPPRWLVTYLIVINLVAFLAMGLDQILAEKGKLRIHDRVLLALAMAGGTPGIYAARHMFQHKLEQGTFSDDLIDIAFLNVGLLIVGSIMGWDEFLEALKSGSTGRGGMTVRMH